MRKTLTLLIASTALTASIGLPAWSALVTPSGGPGQRLAAVPEGEPAAAPVVLASDDDDDDRPRWLRAARTGGHDDDDDDDDHDGGTARNAAPAGTVAPPANGLFGTGGPPQARVN